MDPNLTLQEKQQKLAQNITDFKEQMDEYSTLKGENLSQERFAAYDAGTMREKDAKLFKQQLKEALMMKPELAGAFRTEQKYASLVDEAENERAQLVTDANRTGADKVVHDFFGTKRKRANARLGTLDKVPEQIKRKSAIDDLFDEHKNEFDTARNQWLAARQKRMADATAYNNGEQVLSPTEAERLCIEHEKAAVTGDSTEEIERKKADIDWKYSDLRTCENLFFGKYDSLPGAFMQRSTLYSAAPERLALVRRVDDFQKTFRTRYRKEMIIGDGGLPNSDVARDLARLCKPAFQAGSATEADMKAAYDHFTNINTIAIHGASKTQKDDQGKETTVPVLDKETITQSFKYTGDRLKEFDEETSTFMDANPDLFLTYPSYELLIKNCDAMSEYYKKSQAMAKVGNNLYEAVRKLQSANPKPFDFDEVPALKEVMENAEKLASRCGGLVKLFSTLFTQGRKWDEAVGEKGKVPTLEEMQERYGATLIPVKPFDAYVDESRRKLPR